MRGKKHMKSFIMHMLDEDIDTTYECVKWLLERISKEDLQYLYEDFLETYMEDEGRRYTKYKGLEYPKNEEDEEEES